MRRDDPDALFVPSHVLPIIHPKASVVTIHDLGHRAAPEGHSRHRRAMLEITTRWNLKAAARIITPSAHTRDDLVRMYSAPMDRIDVIPHGVDHDRFQPIDHPEAEGNLQAVGIDGPFVLFLSTIQPRKNVNRLIEAFEQLQLTDHSLVLAGKIGWMSDTILNRARESTANVVVTGHVPDDLIPSLYSAADIFVLPSLYEGFGMGVLEAMACGCPVVVSDRASLTEVGGDAAVVVDPMDTQSIANGIAYAMRRSDELRSAGIKRAAQFTWVAAAKSTLDSIQRAWRETHG